MPCVILICIYVFVCAENFRSLYGGWSLKIEKQKQQQRRNQTLEISNKSAKKSRRYFLLFRPTTQNKNHKSCRLLRFFLSNCSLFSLIDIVNVLVGWMDGWMDKQLTATSHINYSHFQKGKSILPHVRGATELRKRTSNNKIAFREKKCSRVGVKSISMYICSVVEVFSILLLQFNRI